MVSDFEVLYNGLQRAILVLTDTLYDYKGKLNGDQINAITDSIIALVRERDKFIERRKTPTPGEVVIQPKR